LSQLPKEIGGFGQDLRETFMLSLGGSVGSSSNGILPQSNTARAEQAVYTPRRLYARARIDNLLIENSRTSEDSVVNVLDLEIKQKLLSFNRNRARMFFNDSSSTIGQFTGPATGTAATPTVTILNTGRYRRRRLHFEPRDYVNVGVAGLVAAAPNNPPFATPPLASTFEVLSFNPTTGALALSRLDGTDDLTTLLATTNYNLYMQNSWNSDCTGIFDICFGSTYYGLPAQYRFQPFVLPGTVSSDAGNSELTTDMLTAVYDLYSAEAEQSFTHIVMPPVQWRKYKSLLESQKRFTTETKMYASPSGIGDDKLVAKVGYSAIKFFGAESSTVVTQHRLLRDDMVVFLNKNHIKQRHVAPPAWFEKEGSMWLREQGVDHYEARYGAYCENIINPYHVGFIQGLSTTEL
jgi:hypothetical protein